MNIVEKTNSNIMAEPTIPSMRIRLQKLQENKSTDTIAEEMGIKLITVNMLDR